MVRRGVTVRVAPGRYRGPLTIERGGTAKRPVHFVSTRRWGARISARSSDALAVVAISGDHVTFEGFDVTGRGGDGSAAIHAEANHDVVVGNRVHDLAVPCLETGNGGAGILVGGGREGYRNHSGLVVGNLVERVGSGPRDGSCRLVHGIYASVPEVTIVNNIVHRSAGDGITSWHAARRLMISNNVSARNGGAGILIGSGDGGATRAGHRGTLVSNNIAYRNMLDGITESSDGEHRVGPGNRYLHNLAFGNDAGESESSSGVGDLFPGAIESRTLNADPRFARETVGSGRAFSLLPDSPAVDAGTCAGAPRDTFDGAARPQGGGVDIGPRELSSTARRCDE
jgi:Right handed beta helix region